MEKPRGRVFDIPSPISTHILDPSMSGSITAGQYSDGSLFIRTADLSVAAKQADTPSRDATNEMDSAGGKRNASCTRENVTPSTLNTTTICPSLGSSLEIQISQTS